MTDFNHYRAPRYWLRLHIAAGVIALAVGVSGWGAADDYAAGQGKLPHVGPRTRAEIDAVRDQHEAVHPVPAAPNNNAWTTYFARCIDGDTVVYIDPWDGSAKAIQCSVVMLDARP